MDNRPYLILDCYFDELGSAPSMQALLGAAPAVVVRAVNQPLPDSLDSYTGVVITGSKACLSDPEPWMTPLLELLRRGEREGKPMLGVCFGHQAIAAALAGPSAIRLAPQSELGWETIRVDSPNEILDGLGTEFRCFLSHFDEVAPDLPRLNVFASSERCAVQGFQVAERPIWGLQFHPEMDPAESESLVRRNLERHTSLPNDPEAILAGALDGRYLGRRIFENFMKVCGVPRTPR